MPASKVLPLVPLLALNLACTLRPLSDDSATDAGTTADTSTGEIAPTSTTTTTGPATTTTTTTTTTAADATSEPGPDTCGFICAPDLPTDNDCDGWIMPEQDCPLGQKCTIEGAFSDTHCVDVVPDPKAMYEPCQILMGDELSGFDDCGPGLLCWDIDPDTGVGRCIGLCLGPLESPTCVDEATSCVLCQDCAVGLCIPGCNPLLQDCSNDDVCIPDSQGDGFLCVLDASGDEGQLFDPCEFTNACDPGLLCANPDLASECDPMVTGCCLPFCDLTLPDCPGKDQTCLPWYEQGMAPPGLENVGVCGLPQ